LKVSTTVEIWQDLMVLAASGRFGKTPSEVAEGFVRDRVRQHTLEGWLPMTKKMRRRQG
jgi:hypothetical protein